MTAQPSAHQRVTQAYWVSVVARLQSSFPWLEPNDWLPRLYPALAASMLVPDLLGRHSGRDWHVNPLYDPLTGEMNLRVLCTFRGSPIGRERERRLAWFFMGPLPGILGTPAIRTGSRVLRMASRDTGTKARASPLPGVRSKIAVVASGPELAEDLRSAAWTTEYGRWEAMRFGPRGFPPFAFGFPPAMQFVLPLHQKMEAKVISEVLERLSGLLETVDRDFGAPVPTAMPIETIGWRQRVVSSGGESHVDCRVPAFLCPRCHEMEAAFVSSDRDHTPTNLVTARCLAPIYAPLESAGGKSSDEVAGLAGPP